MPEPGKKVDLLGWAKGLNRTSHPSLLAAEELAEATNVDLGPRGEINLRKGFIPYLMDGVNHTGTGVTYFWMATVPPSPAFPDHPEPIIAVRTIGVNAIDVLPYGTEVGDIAQTGRPSVLVLNGKYYLVSSSHTDQAVEIEVTAGPAVTATTLTWWDGLSDVVNEFPSAAAAKVIYERVFAGDIKDGLESRLFFSEPLLPLTWKTTNFIDISPDDGESITALEFFADQVVIFKEHSIWGIAGTDFEGLGLSLYLIDGARGTKSRDTVVNTGTGIIFFDVSLGIYLWDGSQMTNIGEPVFDYIKENLAPVNTDDAHAYVYNDKYYLTIPWDPLVVQLRTFVYDFKTGAWTEHQYGMAAVGKRYVQLGAEDDTAGNVERVVGVRPILSGFAATYYATSTPVNGEDGVYQMHEGGLDNGSAIFGFAKTGYLSPDTPMASHRMRRSGFLFAGTDLDTTVFMYVDGDEITAVNSVTISSGSQEFIRTRILNRPRFRMLQLGLEFNTTPFDAATGSNDPTFHPWQLSQITLEYSTLPGIRTNDPT